MEFRKSNLEAFQKKYGIKLGFMSVFAKASAYALQDQPVVNAVIDGHVRMRCAFVRKFISKASVRICLTSPAVFLPRRISYTVTTLISRLPLLRQKAW